MSNTPSLQSCLTSLATFAQHLPPDYCISIRMLQHGYTIEVIDPDGTSLAEVATPRLFVELVLIAQMDALRRASECTHESS